MKELNKEEWWDVARILKPTLTWEQFEELWEEFQRRKEEGSLVLQ